MYQELDHAQVLKLLPDRDVNAHKGDFGRTLLLCGSEGYTGAAALAAMGALRTGAGLVFLGVPRCIYAIEAVKLNEAIVFPLSDGDGKISCEALPEIQSRLDRMDAVLVGPGCGQSAGVLAALELVLRSFHGPVIIDADGINLLSQHKYLLRDRTAPTILTPHDGEFARLGGTLNGDRVDAAQQLAKSLNAIVLRKGHRTVITDGDHTYINSTGNPGMAVGGSGDLLAGMITGLVGQGMTPLEATACAAWLHGRAGDLCAQELGQYGMLPTDMLEVLPRLLK